MTDDEQEKIRCLVDQLDQLVPRQGAHVRLEQYGGGPDEGRFVANQTGFLRFGIEFLKGGLVRHQDQEVPLQRATTVDLDYLVSENSVIGFDEFVLNDALSADRPTTSSRANLAGLALGVGCLALVIFAVIVLLLGIGQWLSGAA